MKTHPGVAAKVFTHARRRGHQHRDDLHVADPISCVVPRRPRRPTRCARCTPRSSCRATDTIRPERPVRAVRRRMSGTASPSSGATGAVGHRHARASLRERGFPAAELVAVRLRALRRPELDGGLVVQPLRRRHDRGLRPRAVLAPAAAPRASGRRASPRRGATVVDNSCALRMDPDVPLVVTEVNPDALERRTQGHRRQPELHDDGRRCCRSRRCTTPSG